MTHYLVRLSRPKQISDEAHYYTFGCWVEAAADVAQGLAPRMTSRPIPQPPDGYAQSLRSLDVRDACQTLGKERADTLLHYLSLLPRYHKSYVSVGAV